MKKGTRHEWREITPEGLTRYIRALHFGGDWEFFERLKEEEDWTTIESVPVVLWQDLHKKLFSKYQRKRLGWETLNKVTKIIHAHPDMAGRTALLELLHNYDEKYPEEKPTVSKYQEFVEEFPDCFERNLLRGHITGSSFIVDPPGVRTLLTHHKKLDKWLQPGGHADGDTNLQNVALTEAQEETGILNYEFLSEELFDIDIHPIPERLEAPAHLHYDGRFLLQAQHTDYIVSDESHDLAWVKLDELENYTDEESMIRMRNKCIQVL